MQEQLLWEQDLILSILAWVTERNVSLKKGDNPRFSEVNWRKERLRSQSPKCRGSAPAWGQGPAGVGQRVKAAGAHSRCISL